MANYNVSVDITMCKMVSVEAESEDEAMEKVSEMITKNPYNYTSGFSHYVAHEVTDAEEE